ncbi:hypothetical protein LTR10_002848 [Elasticomyces elasticus]|nr:hypothetical protein LTR10_002848 [Elasticomyces elasticus]KAK4967812.1 hypothetical protein LTR42_010139 [Elasticomyces elasticus]
MAPTVSDTPVKFSLAAVSAQQKQEKAKRSAPNPLVEYHTAVPLTHTMARDEEDPADMYTPSPSEARRQRSVSPSDPPFEARSRWCYSESLIASNPPLSHHTAVPLTHWMHKWAQGVDPNVRESTSSEGRSYLLRSVDFEPGMLTVDVNMTDNSQATLRANDRHPLRSFLKPHPAERPPFTCQLWRLPRELRDQIWTYALVEDHDLTATTAIRSLGGKQKRKGRKIRHEFKSHPRLPALTDACKTLREESSIVFWSENIFRLRVGDAKSGYALSHYRKDAAFSHVVLCFDIAYTVDGHNLVRSKQAAELEIKLKADGTASFALGSWLGKECVCQLIGDMEEYIHKKRKSLKHTGLLRLALDFDPRLRWLYERKTDWWADNWSEICDDCGKKIWNDARRWQRQEDCLARRRGVDERGISVVVDESSMGTKLCAGARSRLGGGGMPPQRYDSSSAKQIWR